MQLTIDTKISAAKNASGRFDKAKKLKRKLEGTKKAITEMEEKLRKEVKPETKKKTEIKIIDRKQEWFEKFKWFYTSLGLLVVGGRDAQTNDEAVKSHANPEDPVFHTEMPGSPFCIIQLEGKKQVDKKSLDETAQFCASNSRAWREQLNPCEVMEVKREQLKKTGGLKAGSWMVLGKRNLYRVTLKLALGVTDDFLIMCGPLSAVEAKCTPICVLTPGDTTKEEVAKHVRDMIEKKMKLRFSTDTILRALPPGSCHLNPA